MSKKEVKFKLSPSYVLSQLGAELRISGGADAIYSIDIDADKPSFFSSLAPNKQFSKKDITSQDLEIFEQLLMAQVVVPVISRSKKLKVYSNLKPSIKLADGLSLVEKLSESDLVVLVRQDQSFEEFLGKQKYSELEKPHILLDLAYNHTVSVGPLVFPGSTACLSCLNGRLAVRWGDEKPPKIPAVLSDLHDIAWRLLEVELKKIADNNLELINTTVAWDVNNRSVKSNTLYKVPVCPVCKNWSAKLDFGGRIELPFL